MAGGLQSHTRYRLRYRVTQDSPGTTLLQARVWPESTSEPVAWTIEAFDSQVQLQGTAGSFAIDIYNYSGFGHIYIDAPQESVLGVLDRHLASKGMKPRAITPAEHPNRTKEVDEATNRRMSDAASASAGKALDGVAPTS